MVSGYEKSPDYGGKPPAPYDWVWYLAAFVGFVALLAWLYG